MSSQPEEALPLAEPRKSIVVLYELPNGGFTVGLALAAANAEPGDAATIPVVDVVAMAVVGLLRDMPPEFKAKLEAVSAAVRKTQQDIDNGVDPQVAAQANLEQYGVNVNVGTAAGSTADQGEESQAVVPPAA